MADFLNGTIFGAFIGMVLFVLVFNYCEPKWITDANKAKAECEQNIPRKEVCVPVFFPRSKD